MIHTDIPFIDLHRHLDGNIRPQTILDLGQQHQIKLPATDLASLLPHVQIQGKESNLMSFLQKLDYGVAVLANLEACKRVAYENVEDAYLQGLHYVELRFSPYYMAMAHNLVISEVVAAVIDGIKLGEKDFPVKVNLIGILSRTFGTEHCLKELEGLLAHKNALVAVDLAGDELGKPGGLFIDHFNKVQDAGLQITVHAGEADGASSIWQAINELKAKRIGHGVNAIYDEKLMDYMLEHEIAIESCITSNYQTGSIVDIANHPVKQFLNHGLIVCLNSDDPAVQGVDMINEYTVAAQEAGLSDAQCRTLQANALKAAFLSEAEKKTLSEIVKD